MLNIIRLNSALTCNTITQKAYFHLCDDLRRHWFTNFQRTRPPKISKQNPPTFSFDWEHRRFERSSSSALIPYSEQLEGFESLPDEQKKIYTWGFNKISDDYRHQLSLFMQSQNLHPCDESIFSRVLNMSFKIWYNKSLLDKFPRISNLRASTESLVQRRMRLLRRLRLVNREDCEKALQILRINKIIHLDPFEFKNSSETVLRKRSVREQCYENRLAKLGKLKQNLALEKEKFFRKKSEEIDQLISILRNLNVAENSPKRAPEEELKHLFSMVIADRKMEALAPTRADSLQWYAKEAVLREHVASCIAEREANHLRQKR